MVDLRTFWKDVRKNCNENDSCESAGISIFDAELCSIRMVSSIQIDLIEDMFRGGEDSEH